MKEEKNLNEAQQDTSAAGRPEPPVPEEQAGEEKLHAEAARIIDQADQLRGHEERTRENAQPEVPASDAADAEAAAQELIGAEAPDELMTGDSAADLAPEIASLKTRTSVLFALLVLVIVAAGCAGWYFYSSNLETLNNAQLRADSYVQSLKDAEKQLDDAKNMQIEQQKEIQQLNERHSALMNSHDAIVAAVDGYEARAAEETALLEAVNGRLERYEARNPDDWRLAQSYFLVSSAYRMTIFAKDVSASLWCLESADALLTDIEEEAVVNIRKAIRDDIMKLSNARKLDLRGVINKLDAVYRNLSLMTLIEINTPEQRAAGFSKAETVTESLAQWKENLLSSLRDFSERFVEVRHRGEQAVNAFLSEDQGKLLLENLKTLVTLSKLAVYQADQEAYRSDIDQLTDLIRGFYNPEDTAVKANLEALGSLRGETIEAGAPDVLQSYNLFGQYARQILRINAPATQDQN